MFTDPKLNNFPNIYNTPPNTLLNNLQPKQFVDIELKSHKGVTQLLNHNDVGINELAGFLIVGIEKARIFFENSSATLMEGAKPFSLDKMIGFLKSDINKLDDKKNPKLKLTSDLFDIIVSIRSIVSSIDNMFKKASTRDAQFNKNLICDMYIGSLSNYLLTAQEWCLGKSTETKTFGFNNLRF